MLNEAKIEQMMSVYNNTIKCTKEQYKYIITQTIKELYRGQKNVSIHDLFYRESCTWVQELQGLSCELEAAKSADDVIYVCSLIDRQIEKIAYLTAI